MKLVQQHHFYASHRNTYLENDKCWFLHGHTYYLDVEITPTFCDPESGVTMLFSDLKKRIEDCIKQLDHKSLWFDEDPLYNLISTNMNSMEPGMVAFPFETSVENLAAWLFNEIKKRTEYVTAISLRETTTTVFHFTLEDWNNWDYEKYSIKQPADGSSDQE